MSSTPLCLHKSWQQGLRKRTGQLWEGGSEGNLLQERERETQREKLGGASSLGFPPLYIPPSLFPSLLHLSFPRFMHWQIMVSKISAAELCCC